MFFKKAGDLLRHLKTRGIDYLVGTPNPGMGVQAFTVTGGGTGTDLVVFATTYRNGVACKDMADDNYQVFLGFGATPAGKYAGTKLTTGFTLTGLGSETVDVLVVGVVDGMPLAS